MNIQRGFRRIGWVLIALCAPVIFVITYDRSSHVSKWEPYRLDAPSRSSAEAIAGREVEVPNVGFVHFPDSFPKENIQSFVKQHFTKPTNPARLRAPEQKLSIAEFAKQVRTKRPEYTEPDDLKLTKEVLRRYPEYQSWVSFSEYVLVPHSEKRPLWAVAVSIAVLAALTCLVQGGISVMTWIIKGFRS